MLKIGHEHQIRRWRCSRAAGIAVAPIDDTLLISFVLEGGLHGHELDELADLHFGHDTIKYKDVAGTGKSHVGFAAVPLDKARDYAAEHADIALAPPPRAQAAARRRAASRLLRDDRASAGARSSPRWSAPASASTAPSSARLSEDFAPAHRRARAARSTRSPAIPSTSARPSSWARCCSTSSACPAARRARPAPMAPMRAILEELALTHDLPARVLDWRQLTKLKSTYADALVDEINPATGRVHTTYALAAASTGRLSSTDPNLQNIPIRTEEGRKIRRAFVAEPGHLLHLRRLQPDRAAARGAHVAECRAAQGRVPRRRRHPRHDRERDVRRADEGMDPRDAPPRQGDQFRHHLRHQRLRPGAAARRAAGRGGGLHQGLFRALPRHPRLYGADASAACAREGLCRDARSAGAATSPASRTAIRRAASTPSAQAINAPLQGAAADIIKRAMRACRPALAKAGLKARMLLQVHDELVFEVPEDEAEKTAAVVKEVMERRRAPGARRSRCRSSSRPAPRNWDEAH